MDISNRSNYVYNLCMNKWLIIMEKTHDTITDEDRPNIIDPNRAKFYASELKVLHIIYIDSVDLININKYINEQHINKQHINKKNIRTRDEITDVLAQPIIE